jgi:hypothetical protein
MQFALPPRPFVKNKFEPLKKVFPVSAFIKSIKDDINMLEFVKNALKSAVERTNRRLLA